MVRPGAAGGSGGKVFGRQCQRRVTLQSGQPERRVGTGSPVSCEHRCLRVPYSHFTRLIGGSAGEGRWHVKGHRLERSLGRLCLVPSVPLLCTGEGVHGVAEPDASTASDGPRRAGAGGKVTFPGTEHVQEAQGTTECLTTVLKDGTLHVPAPSARARNWETRRQPLRQKWSVSVL